MKSLVVELGGLVLFSLAAGLLGVMVVYVDQILLRYVPPGFWGRNDQRAPWRFRVDNFSLRDLFTLAQTSEGESRVEKAFDWYFERHKILFQGGFAYLGTFAVGLAASVYKDEIELWFAIPVAVIGLGGPSLYFVARAYRRLRAAEHQYLVAVIILDAFRL
jgi:hypothetical protein